MKALALIVSLLVSAAASAAPPVIVGSPTVVSTPRHPNTYWQGDTIQVQVTLDQPVRLDGWASLTLDIDGDRTRGTGRTLLAYGDGSDYTEALSFHYVVAINDFDNDGVSARHFGLASQGATLRNASGEDAIHSHQEMKDQPSHRVCWNPHVEDGCEPPEPAKIEPTTRSKGSATAACTGGESPYETMNDAQFMKTWQPVVREPYRWTTDLLHDGTLGGVWRRELQVGTLAVSLRVHDGETADRAEQVFAILAAILSNLPGVLTQSLGEVIVDFVPRNSLSSPARVFYPAEIRVSDRFIRTDGHNGPVFLATRYAYRNFEELLVHELAHVFDNKLNASLSQEWADAVAATPCRVSQYAHEDNGEHFAEAATAYLMLFAGPQAGTHHDTLEHRLGAEKIEYLGRLLSPATAGGVVYE